MRHKNDFNVKIVPQKARITQALDHYGIVAGFCDKLQIAARINKRIGSKDPRRVIQPGVAVKAMILNALGFTNNRLYMAPKFFTKKALDVLFDEPITAEQLDDHTLGKALDEIHAYGVNAMFAEIALEIAMENNLFGATAHLDSTSFSLSGAYDTDEVATIEVKRGFSKDHRPDLKQVMLSMVSTGPANIPIWLEPQNGNSSDKKSFHETLKTFHAFHKQMQQGQKDFFWVADSAFYTTEKIRSYDTIKWISRVPETLSCARKLLEAADDTFIWQQMEGGYKYTEIESDNGGVRQRWLLVSSAQAFARESATFERKLIALEQELKKTCDHQSNPLFNCQEDAEKVVKELRKKAKYFTLMADIQSVCKHAGRGRPSKNAEKQHVGYQLHIQISRNMEVIERHLRKKGRFILATNELNREKLSSVKILTNYKNQQSVEGGFRFLKDPWFMVDSFFVKKRSRIAALMFIMALSLLVYNFAQYALRKALLASDQTIPNQKGKPGKRPTMRWIFQIMEGIQMETIFHKKGHCSHSILNIDDVMKTIIRLLGPEVCRIYHLNTA